MVRFPTVGLSRIADGITRGAAAERGGADAAWSGASGPVLWVYGLRRAESERPTWAQVAGVWGTLMARPAMPGPGRIADCVRRRPTGRRADAASSGGDGPAL